MMKTSNPAAEAKFLAACQADHTQVFRLALPDNPSADFLDAIRTPAMIASATLRASHERAVRETGIKVCKSAAGYYLGRFGPEGPIDRDSEQYWRKETEAAAALATGKWTARSSSMARGLQQLGVSLSAADTRLAEIVALQEPSLPPRPKRGRVARPKGVEA